MWDKLKELFAKRQDYDPTTQAALEGWMQDAQEIEAVAKVKELKEWQAIEQRIRAELQLTIFKMVSEAKDERAGRINALLQVLSTLNTKTRAENLEAEVNDFVSKY